MRAYFKKLLSYQFEILPELFNTVGLLSLIPTSPQVDDVVECGTIKKISQVRNYYDCRLQ